MEALKWMHENDVSDETCSVYTAKDSSSGLKCSPSTICG
jgi:hypothetical protein